MPQSRIETILVQSQQLTTSGTFFDFTIPAEVKKIHVIFNDVGVSGTDDLIVQLGDSEGIETIGYDSSSFDSGAISGSVVGMVLRLNNLVCGGIMILLPVSGNTWVSSHSAKNSTGASIAGGGTKTLSGELTTIRVTRSGTDTFDAGSVNITYEF